MATLILRRLRRIDPGVGLAILVLLIVVACAALAPWITTHNPLHQTLPHRLQPPGSPDYLLGTDHLGRDMLSRLVYGSRTSIMVAFMAVGLAGTLGTALGLLGGYLGGKVDALITWLANVQLAFPLMLLAVALAAVLGGSIAGIVSVLAVTSWVGYARVIRAQVLYLRQQDFVQAAQAMGAPVGRIMFRHLLPNALGPLIALASLEVARMVILEAALGFLGLGVPPQVPSWGSMIADGRQYFEKAWWISTLPGALLTLTVISVNLVGDWLNDQVSGRGTRS